MYKDLKNKFIIVSFNENEYLIFLGKCFFHKELLERISIRNKINYKCIGGGEFLLNKINENSFELKLFGNSSDFGKYPLELTKKLIMDKKIFDNPFLNKNLFEKNLIEKISIENYYYNFENINI